MALIKENIRRRGGAPSIQIASCGPDNSLQGKPRGIAAARGIAPEIAAYDLMSRGNASIVSFNMSDQDIRHIMTMPYTMASSDGGLTMPGAGQPHPRNNGAFARRLALYVRDRGVIGLEFAIRTMTSLPATVFRLNNRGMIREGAIADLASSTALRPGDLHGTTPAGGRDVVGAGERRPGRSGRKVPRGAARQSAVEGTVISGSREPC
jgi:N-acyl-D-amino-acid deacylase